MATPKPRVPRTMDTSSIVYIQHPTFNVPLLMLAARPVDGGLNCVLLTQLALDACLIITSKKGFLSRNLQRQEALSSPENAAFLDPGNYYYHCEADADEVYGLCASFADWIPPPDSDSLPPHWNVSAQQGFELMPPTPPAVRIKKTSLPSSPGSLVQKQWYKRHYIYQKLKFPGPIPPNTNANTRINDVRNVISMTPTIHDLVDHGGIIFFPLKTDYIAVFIGSERSTLADEYHFMKLGLPARTENYILYCAFAWTILNVLHRDDNVPTWPSVSIAQSKAATSKKRRRDSSVEGGNKRRSGGGAGADRSRRGSGGADSLRNGSADASNDDGGESGPGPLPPVGAGRGHGGYYPGCERVAELKARYIAEHPEVRATSTSVG
ncbi:hypothetical protein B0H10DRAFT_2208238 [Mycena sp. CBHHK59/15]|nr:hypothetical protein B0H10DRAFT_2208238 [Mycena sp. CBHHK59/15]